MSTIAFSSTMKNAANSVVASTGGTSSWPDRLGRVLADALEVEDGLGEDRAAADHGAEVEAPQRDDRDHRVAQHVPDHDLPLARAPWRAAVRT